MPLIEQAVQPEDSTRGMEHPYMKAWQEWQERYRLERLETTKRLEKQENLTKSWELVRVCRENYSEWQERKTTEDTRKKLKEIPLEKEARLERKNLKSEKFRKYSEMENKEEMYKRRILLAEIKENVWKRRGSRSSHEEHSERLETEKKKVEMGKVRERLNKLGLSCAKLMLRLTS